KFRDAIMANPELKDRPELDALRKTLLKEPMEFFGKLRDRLQADRDTRPEALAKLARANADLAEITREIGSIPDAIQSLTEPIAFLEHLAGDSPTVSEYLSDLAACRNNLGNLRRERGQPAEALESLRKALEIRERLVRDNPTVARYQRDLAISHNNIGGLL